MDNSLLVVRDINHKNIVVGRRFKYNNTDVSTRKNGQSEDNEKKIIRYVQKKKR